LEDLRLELEEKEVLLSNLADAVCILDKSFKSPKEDLVHRSEYNSFKEAYMNDVASRSDSRASVYPFLFVI